MTTDPQPAASRPGTTGGAPSAADETERPIPSESLVRTDYRHADGRRLFVYGPHGEGGLPTASHDDAAASGPSGLHLRRDELTGRWVAISPARNTRPESRTAPAAAPTTATATTAPSCPLCPGGPELPFAYAAAVFENRFPTLVADPPPPPELPGPTAPARGLCEVVLYTSTHHGSIATLTPTELARVIAMWTDRTQALWADPTVRYVLPFENRGEAVGATLSHPHGQLYALDHLPPFAGPRVDALTTHRARHGACLTCRVVARDAASDDRSVVVNGSFTVAVPFAPDWPYEVHVRARRHGARRLVDLTAAERRDLAAALREVVLRYDRLDREPVPYLMTVMEAPTGHDGTPVDDWHLAVEFRPPNRRPGTLKLRASVETVAGLFINDTLPEDSARAVAGVDIGQPPVDPGTFPDVEVVHAST